MSALEAFFSICNTVWAEAVRSELRTASHAHDMLQAAVHLTALTLSTSLCAQIPLVVGTIVKAYDNNYCQCQILQREQ